MSKNVTKNELLSQVSALTGKVVALEEQLQAEQEKNARLLSQLEAALSAAAPTDTEMPNPDQAMERLIKSLGVKPQHALWQELSVMEDGQGLWRCHIPRDIYTQAKPACVSFLAALAKRALQRGLGSRFERDHLIIWVK